MDNQTAGKLGITNIKKTFAFVILSSMMITELVRDFSVTKAGRFAFHLAENQDLVDAAPIALVEAKDIDEVESVELSDFFAEEFDIPNDQLEARIERGIALLPRGYALVKDNLEYYGDVSDYVREWGAPADLPKLQAAYDVM